MKEKATIYDYVRRCDSYRTVCKCDSCPIGKLSRKEDFLCDDFIRKYPRHANKAVLIWCKEHPVKTRQDKFLEMFPNADVSLGYLDICPMKVMGVDWNPDELNCTYTISQIRQIEICEKCLKSYWLAEVEE